MKGNFCRIVLGLFALGGIACTTLGIEAPKGFGEPTKIGQPVEKRDAHLNQLEAPITLINRGLSGVAVAGGRSFLAIDAIFDFSNLPRVGDSYGSGDCAVSSGGGH